MIGLNGASVEDVVGVGGSVDGVEDTSGGGGVTCKFNIKVSLLHSSETTTQRLTSLTRTSGLVTAFITDSKIETSGLFEAVGMKGIPVVGEIAKGLSTAWVVENTD